MLDRLEDTIVAISSAPGYGAIGIVRLGGPQAIHISNKIAHCSNGKSLADQPGSSRCRGQIKLDQDQTLPSSFYIFRAPHSYTRQNLVEIHTVGSPAALELIRQKFISLGALPAQPGEFTARAFLMGSKSLSEAEAVAGSIRAQSDTQLRAARRMMDGTLSKKIKKTRDELAEIVALVEADIDFAEEPIDFITPHVLTERLTTIDESLQQLLSGSISMERFDVLPRILLIGPPNAGKSSLMNCLSKTPRAICAAAAGTTRDILSAPILLGRGEAILLDTAGVDQSEDDIIAQAREMTLSTAEHVDLLCVVVDISQAIDQYFLEKIRAMDIPRCVVVANKCDLIDRDETNPFIKKIEKYNLGTLCMVSALQKTGIEELQTVMENSLDRQSSTTMGEAVLISERQQAAIHEAIESLTKAKTLSSQADETIDFADLIAFELREALDQLGWVTGEVTTEDLLGQVFANFCIGK